ncbi:opacity protein-like surface antigen [Hasllibacter halocynthiae]|uniref:Opacity protein-like surface antigen n=1 Tax=Hasllibacter halocynthiae TaxID=595589 RepID=A0A2T0X3G3_9RHOB|nr:outer membrane beta-barrel protein [Hasllibacter halocynthiae]PRY93457.1 opacity protein-like surface antigen [Hasllibacter halocynthiae]
MKTIIAAVAVAAATAAAGAASAQNALGGSYVGIFAATSEFDSPGAPDVDGQRLGFAIGRNAVTPAGFYAGFEFSAAFSNAEGSAEIAGTGVALTIEEEYEVAASVRLGYAVNKRAAVYGKLSVRSAYFNLSAGPFSEDDSGSTLGVGFGGEYALGGGFGIALEYDRYDYELNNGNDREGSTISLGIRRGF